MKDELKLYIEKNIHLIEHGNMDELYAGLSVDLRPYLTEALMISEIDPLQGSLAVPSGFASNTNTIKQFSCPSNCLYIGSCAFKGSELESIKLNEGLEEIGREAFSFCHSLIKVVMPSSVKRIEDSAFLDCNNLKYLDLGNNLEYIPKFMLKQCYNLEYVKIPASINKIDFASFAQCHKLKEIVFDGTKLKWLTINKADNWRYECGVNRVLCNDGVFSYE